jgi:hypothetical protein
VFITVWSSTFKLKLQQASAVKRSRPQPAICCLPASRHVASQRMSMNHDREAAWYCKVLSLPLKLQLKTINHHRSNYTILLQHYATLSQSSKSAQWPNFWRIHGNSWSCIVVVLIVMPLDVIGCPHDTAEFWGLQRARLLCIYYCLQINIFTGADRPQSSVSISKISVKLLSFNYEIMVVSESTNNWWSVYKRQSFNEKSTTFKYRTKLNLDSQVNTYLPSIYLMGVNNGTSIFLNAMKICLSFS